MKCSGRFVTAAWLITGSDDVLVANSASCLTIGSSAFHISSFSVEVLGDRLDHQVAVGEVLVFEGAA